MEIQEQIKKAKKPLAEALERLRKAGYGEIAQTMEQVFPMEFTYLLEGNEKNPVHHTAHVANFMTEILLGEEATPDQIKQGVFAALLHDVGLARTDEGKIRKADLQQEIDMAEDWDGVSKAIAEAIRSRKSHMKAGADIARLLLHGYNDWTGKPFFDPQKDIATICRIVEIHDDPSIFEYERMGLEWIEVHPTAGGLTVKPDPGKWLFDKDAFLVQCHREADRVWMVSPDGIEVDLARDLAKARKKAEKEGLPLDNVCADPAERINGNIRRHREEMQLYQQAFQSDLVAAYGFKNRLLCRTDTGYAVFCRLVAELEALYQVSTDL
ncbi:MAG: hypothetical protein H8E44_04825 [Planctomycetes bacterium]|nr:hypothetical protein [Planctomycetota bacterium]MBL7038927.1 hypothetical protein [Pirellulaceae bacterium]